MVFYYFVWFFFFVILSFLRVTARSICVYIIHLRSVLCFSSHSFYKINQTYRVAYRLLILPRRVPLPAVTLRLTTLFRSIPLRSNLVYVSTDFWIFTGSRWRELDYFWQEYLNDLLSKYKLICVILGEPSTKMFEYRLRCGIRVEPS